MKKFLPQCLQMWKGSLHLQPLSEKRSLKRPGNGVGEEDEQVGLERNFQQTLAEIKRPTTFAVPIDGADPDERRLKD